MRFKNIIRWNLAHRWIVLGIFLIITAAAATQLPKLRFDFSPEAMLEFSQEEIDYQHSFDAKFHSNPNAFLLVVSSEDTLVDAAPLTALRDLTDAVESVPGVAGAYSLARVPDNSGAGLGSLLSGEIPAIVPPKGNMTAEQAAVAKERVRNSSLLRGNLVSEDGKNAMVLAMLDPEHADPEGFYPVYEGTEKLVEAWKAAHPDLRVDYGGLPYIRSITVDTMKREQLILWPIVGLLYIFALCIVFRSFWQAILPMACIGCVVLWAIAIMVVNDMPVTMINNTLPLLILVIGVTNGIYVLMRMLDERRKGKDKPRAISDGVYRVALATLLTTSTTSIGFGSLLVAKTKILNGFGGITALAVMLIYVAIIFLMPQVASLIGLDPKKAHSADAAKEDGHIERGLEALTRFTVAHRKLVIVASVALLAACLATTTQISFESKVNDVFQDDHPITVTNTLIEEKLGGMLPVEVDIWTEREGYFRDASNLAVLCGLQRDLRAAPGVLSALSLCSLLEEGGVVFASGEVPAQPAVSSMFFAMNRFQPEQLHSFITEAGNNVHISLRIPDNGFENSKKIIADVRALAERAFAGTSVQYRLTGIGYNSTLGLDHFMSDLFTSLLTAFIIIFAILFVAFRNFWSGAVAILPNLIPISMTLAFLPLYGYNLNTTSVLVFTISIGLAVDNSIHIISRFRQEYRGDATVAQALKAAMTSSGRAILQSNVLLCSGLAVLLLSDFDPIRRVGVLTLTTIGAALVVSMILIPAEIACIGHRMRLPQFRRELEAKREETPQPESETHEDDTIARKAETSDATAAAETRAPVAVETAPTTAPRAAIPAPQA